MTKTLFQRLDQPLHQLIAEEAIEGKGRLLSIRRAIIKLSDAIRGASRRSMPTAERWAEIIVGLDDLAKRCPAELRTALQEAKLEACGQMKALVTDPKEAGRASARPVAYAKALVARESAPNRGRVAPQAARKGTVAARIKALKDAGARPDFRIETLLKAADDGAKPTVTGVASSDVVDLDGDRMSQSALQRMVDGFKGLSAFLNHQYEVPESLFGVIRGTRLARRGNATDMDVAIDVLKSNPRAMQAFEGIKEGARLGLSVGVVVLDWKEAGKGKGGRKIIEITDILPLEISVCGIPANPRSWISQAMDAVKGKAKSNSGSLRQRLEELKGAKDRLLDRPMPTKTDGRKEYISSGDIEARALRQRR